MIIAGLLALLAPGGATARAQDDASWLLAQINGLRGGLGLPAYTLNAQLSAAATQHSQSMAATCNVSHAESDGSLAADRARANGYTGGWISENIYGGLRARAADAWAFWTTSPVHYRGLTHTEANEIGIGVAASACGQYFTLVFGKSAGSSSAPQQAAPQVSALQAAAPQVAAPQVAAPTAIPYVPPTRTPTPTPTIPTLTPSATWTITPTHTASPTPSVPPPTGTALVLPTVPALTPSVPSTAAPGVAVAAAVTPVDTPVPAWVDSPGARRDSEDGLSLRDLVPAALVVQVLIIGLAAYVYWRRGE